VGRMVKCYYCKKSNTTNMFELFGDSKPENKTQTLVVNCRHCGKLVQIDVEH